MDRWTCEECKTEFAATMAALRAHLKEKHHGVRLKHIGLNGRVGWTTEPITDLELSNMEASALRNEARWWSDGDEFDDLSEEVFDLVDEVRRLRAELEASAPVNHVRAEALREERRAERKRCLALVRGLAPDCDAIAAAIGDYPD